MMKTKKVMMAAAVLCLGLLLCTGSRIASVIEKTGAYNLLASADARTVEYPSGGETGENFIPFSSSGKMGMYIMLGSFERPFDGSYGRPWAEFMLYVAANWENFPSAEKKRGGKDNK